MAIDFNGRQVTFSELSHAYGISNLELRIRYKQGKRDDELVAGAKYKHQVVIDNKLYSIHHLAKERNIHYSALLHRFKTGLTGNALLYGMDHAEEKPHTERQQHVDHTDETVQAFYVDVWLHKLPVPVAAAKYGISASYGYDIKMRRYRPSATDALEEQRRTKTGIFSKEKTR